MLKRNIIIWHKTEETIFVQTRPACLFIKCVCPLQALEAWAAVSPRPPDEPTDSTVATQDVFRTDAAETAFVSSILCLATVIKKVKVKGLSSLSHLSFTSEEPLHTGPSVLPEVSLKKKGGKKPLAQVPFILHQTHETKKSDVGLWASLTWMSMVVTADFCSNASDICSTVAPVFPAPVPMKNLINCYHPPAGVCSNLATIYLSPRSQEKAIDGCRLGAPSPCQHRGRPNAWKARCVFVGNESFYIVLVPVRGTTTRGEKSCLV